MKTINTLTFAALAATLLFQTPIARADNNGAATINFTKWVTVPAPRPGVFSDMAGIIGGGDVGDGTFTGVVTDGWLKGHAVNGEFTIIPPCVGTVFNCIEVTLDIIKRDLDDSDDSDD